MGRLVAGDNQQSERREVALDRHRLAPVDPVRPLVDPLIQYNARAPSLESKVIARPQAALLIANSELHGVGAHLRPAPGPSPMVSSEARMLAGDGV